MSKSPLGRLGVFSANDVCRILERHGFLEARRRGSHIVMQRQTGEGTATVVVPNHRQIAQGTLSAIIRHSGLGRQVFEHRGK